MGTSKRLMREKMIELRLCNRKPLIQVLTAVRFVARAIYFVIVKDNDNDMERCPSSIFKQSFIITVDIASVFRF
jgi:hypothetical protein